MAFALPDEPADLAQALRDAEAQAPKQLKPLLIEAANFIDSVRRKAPELAETLELAAALRAGVMDSDSRQADVANEVRLTITSVAETLRRLS